MTTRLITPARRRSLLPTARRGVTTTLLVGALLGAALVASPAQAKITNVQSLAGKPVDEGFSGQVSLAGNLRAGNVQLALATLDTTCFYRIGQNVLLFNAKGSYGLKGAPGEWDDDPFRERLFEHLRYRRNLNERWSVESFVQHEYDRWRRLKLRALAGGGLRIDIDTGKESHLAFGLAYMALWEELLEPTPVDQRGVYLEHRLSSYVNASAKVGERTSLTLTCYLQPNLANFGDLRGLVDGAIAVSLTDQLALKVNGWWAFDTDPPNLVRGYDVNTTVGFALTL